MRDAVHDSPDWCGLVTHHGRERREPRFALKRPPAAQRFIKNSAQGENVGAPVHFLALGLLRRHVTDSSNDGARLRVRPVIHRGSGQLIRAARLHQFRQAEVQDLHQSIVHHHDVRRL